MGTIMQYIKTMGKELLRYRKVKKRYTKWHKTATETLKSHPQPPLSDADIKKIDAYWEQYGIKFTDYSWYQLYYGATKIKDPRFMPKEIHCEIVLSYYNNKDFVAAYKDKNSFDVILPEKILPKTIIKKIAGDYYDKDGIYISPSEEQKLIDILLDKKQVIVKNAVDTGRGLNVKKYSFDTAGDVLKMLKQWNVDNYLIQEVISQHKFFSRFNESSVNIIRINTWYHDGIVDITTPVLRFGLPGYATDVCYINGEETVQMVGVTNDGYLRDRVASLDGTSKSIYDVIPDIDLAERVPSWDKLVNMVKENASRLKHFKIIGWDVTVTDEGEPVVIEYNISSPSPHAPQLTDGPFWGDLVDDAMAFLLDKNNQEKYVPKFLQVKSNTSTTKKMWKSLKTK